jgi:hypothetical protein
MEEILFFQSQTHSPVQPLWIEGGPKAHKHEWMDLESQTVGE